ncbi:Methyl-accepting chemotaxis protein I (serine chemoreceptor protein) [hydrothermal vent metagenome]|uniref:Methyl-accepting chemotaxis protein I (Serine chemoreceptor protein) n=1 Tax=hydrothermal vent metagenome TaxID=652676 RepID=A0A3B0WXW9_9ZZZZ
MKNLRPSAKVDAQGIITEVNQDYLDLLGYSLDEMLGQPIQHFRSDDFPNQIQEDLKTVLMQGLPYHGYVIEKNSSGADVYLSMTLFPQGSAENYQGYASVNRLLTEEEIQMVKRHFQLLLAGKERVMEGTFASSLFMSTIGRVFKLKSLPMMIAAAVITSSLILLIAFTHGQTQKQEVLKSSIDSYAKTVEAELEGFIDKNKLIGETNLVGLTKSDFVRSAVDELDIDTLVDEFNGVNEHYKSNSVLQNIAMQVFDAEGNSMYRSWVTEEEQDIIPVARIYINEVLKRNKSDSFFVLEKEGLALKSAIPLYFEGEIVGVAEMSQDFSAIKKEIESLQGYFFTIAIADKYLKQIPGRVNDKSPLIGKDALYYIDQNTLSQEKADFSKHLDVLKNVSINLVVKEHVIYQDGYMHISRPILDVRGESIGTMIVSIAAKEFEAYLDKNLAVVEGTFYGVAVSSIVTTFSLLLLLWLLLIRPIKRMEEQITEAVNSSDLFKRADVIGRNEMADLGRAYNKQVSLFQQVMNDSSNALSHIVQGDLATRITTDYKADFLVIKDQLNATMDGLQNTFERINLVLTDLRHGEFGNEHPNVLKGEYYEIVESAKNTMHELSSVFKDIDRVMVQASKGDFTQRIDVKSSGDIQALISIINTSMDNLEKGFDDIVEASQRIAEGDFTHLISNDYEYKIDEAKQAINKAVTDLKQVISGVKSVALNVRDSAQSVASGTEQLNERTREQASSLEQTASAMEQTSAQVESNLESTKVSNTIAEEQSDILVEANKTMLETQGAMQAIKEASGQISSITSLIDSIAFQTNLLALNAAVEAARAGEHGRGFAVVASEVRSLAGKSADAAKEINVLVGKTAQAIDDGVNKVDTVNTHLEKITSETERMKQIVSEISVASNEQAEGVKQVNHAITSIDSVTQQNTSLVADTYLTTEKMIKSADELIENVSKFKV